MARNTVKDRIIAMNQNVTDQILVQLRNAEIFQFVWMKVQILPHLPVCSYRNISSWKFNERRAYQINDLVRENKRPR